MSDRWTDRLSEYVDGELAAADRAMLEEHLAACESCRATAAELRLVKDRAAALDDVEPAADLWPGIAGRLGSRGAVTPLRPRRERRRVVFTVPQLVAAALALMCMSAGTAWLALRSSGVPAATLAPTVAMSPSESALVAVVNAPTSYDAAVADLQRVLTEHGSDLDSATVRVLETNLTTIDRAISDARAALARDPANAYLNEHLAATMARKLELLRRAAAMAVAS